MSIEIFERVTKICHPAAKQVFAFLESLSAKNKKTFAASFGARPFIAFFANLPGAVKVHDAKELIDMHDEFLQSPISQFEYGEIKNGVGGVDFFMCSVPARVTLPNGTKREVCIDMTFFKADGTWIPGRFINTVVDPAHIALEKPN